MSFENTAESSFHRACSLQESSILVSLMGPDRWEIYRRLQELDIPCTCSSHQPLTVMIQSSGTAIQLWSIQQRYARSRKDAIALLQKIWQQSSD